jgi:hypothetical protein
MGSPLRSRPKETGVPTNLNAIVERGERIYNEKYREEYEAKHLGKFVAIDVTTERAYLSDTPETALQEGRTQNPSGVFHLIRIGSPGVFRVGYSAADSDGDWLSGR